MICWAWCLLTLSTCFKSLNIIILFNFTISVAFTEFLFSTGSIFAYWLCLWHAGSLNLQIGCSVTGIIDGKFDNGYLVTVNLGSDQLKGVLYHIPHMHHVSQSSNDSVAPTQRRRKRSRLALRDPTRPKSNRSGYNFFFAEHYARLKPHYYGQEKAISKKIGVLWSNLTEAEKQVYKLIILLWWFVIIFHKLVLLKCISLTRR